jgi:pimeloyl-ACP methyl ester carboxylesterase
VSLLFLQHFRGNMDNWDTAVVDGLPAHRLLVVNGSNDIKIPTVHAFTLPQQLPNAELILYPNAGNGSLLQYSEWFVDEASRFPGREW